MARHLGFSSANTGACAQAQVHHSLLVLARALDPWRRPKGSWALGTRLRLLLTHTFRFYLHIHCFDMAPSSLRSLTGIRHLCSIKWQFRFLIFLILCSCTFYFVILHYSANKKPFAFVFLNTAAMSDNNGAPFLMIFPHSATTKEKTLEKTDELALEKLREFLDSMRDFDGATCLQPSTHNSEQLWKHQDINTTRNISSESSWCRFIKRNWSLHIRNTGPVQKAKLRNAERNATYASFPKPEVNSTIEEFVLQNCNIVQGPFAIRKEAFHRIGGLLEGFGKVTLLEFFLRSKGELKIAKLANCSWTPEITRTDRGTLEGSNTFSEYSLLGNKHQILRIVTGSRIE